MAIAEKEATEKGKEIQKAPPARALTPFEEMDRMMDRMFEGFMPRGWMRPWRFEWPAMPELAEIRMPSVDVVDRENEVLVRAEIPGVDKKDLDVTVTENTVTIKGSSKREEKEEKGDYYRCEISRGAFARTLTLPATVDSDRAKASFKDGVLELTLPKIEKSRRRNVTIE
jgi:HSP20 family protein